MSVGAFADPLSVSIVGELGQGDSLMVMEADQVVESVVLEGVSNASLDHLGDGSIGVVGEVEGFIAGGGEESEIGIGVMGGSS